MITEPRPEVREAHGFGARHVGKNLLLTLPFVVLLVATFLRASEGRWDKWTWLGIGVFVIGAWVGRILERDRWAAFRCAECGERPGAPELAPGAALDFHCQRCGILWTTGLSVPED